MKTKSSININVEALKEFKVLHDFMKKNNARLFKWEFLEKSIYEIFEVANDRQIAIKDTIKNHKIPLDDFVEVLSAITNVAQNPQEVCYLLCQYWIDYVQKKLQEMKSSMFTYFSELLQDIATTSSSKDEILTTLTYASQRFKIKAIPNKNLNDN